jgi:DNA adenine methylase
MPAIEPFIRWAGGKTWLIKYISDIMGQFQFNHYHEIFLGGGAIFFALDHTRRAYLSDLNQELISTYIAVRDFPNEVIEVFLKHEISKENYYKVRSEIPETAIEKAARFIYLNQTSYNGLYRVNKQGQYNVPYGYRDTIKYDTKKIKEASKKLKKANIKCEDFMTHKKEIQRNDLIFLDPPYTVSHNNNGFIKYNQNLFSLQDQRRLSNYIDYIKRKEAYYILTNAAHPTIQEIFYKGDRQVTLNRQSLIGGKNSKREMISEYIFTNIPEEVLV